MGSTSAFMIWDTFMLISSLVVDARPTLDPWSKRRSKRTARHE
jgi:hypothetical protein